MNIIKQIVLAGCATLVTTGFAQKRPELDKETCVNGVCPLPTDEEKEEPAAQPLPSSAVKPIVQAPRLKTLNGKTIALVGGSFMASVTHPELKRLIIEEFPTAKIYLLNLNSAVG